MVQKKLFAQEQVRYLKNSLLINGEILVIGDLHLGYEDEIVRGGVIPNIQLKEVLDDLSEIFEKLELEKVKLKEIVLLGDLKQEFGVITDNEWRDVLRLLDVLLKKCDKVVVIKGNHDMKLGPILRKRGVDMVEYYKVELKESLSTSPPKISNIKNKQEVKSNSLSKRGQDVLGLENTEKKSSEGRNAWFLHGHKLFKHLFKQGLDKQTVRQTDRQTDKKDILVLGHLHPAISLSDEYKKEKYKCFLKGNWRGFVVYIIPNFSNVHFGYDIRNLFVEKINKKRKRIRKHDFFVIDDRNLKKFEVIVYDESSEKELLFGSVKDLIEK